MGKGHKGKGYWCLRYWAFACDRAAVGLAALR